MEYCTYIHINKQTQSWFYIGSGSKDRPYELSTSQRSKTYWKFIEDNNIKISDIEIVIVKTDADKQKCWELEQILIASCRDRLNLANWGTDLEIVSKLGFDSNKFVNDVIMPTFQATKKQKKKILRKERAIDKLRRKNRVFNLKLSITETENYISKLQKFAVGKVDKKCPIKIKELQELRKYGMQHAADYDTESYINCLSLNHSYFKLMVGRLIRGLKH